MLNVTGAGVSTPADFSGGGLQNPTLKPAYLQINYAQTGTIRVAGNSTSAAVVYSEVLCQSVV